MKVGYYYYCRVTGIGCRYYATEHSSGSGTCLFVQTALVT